MRTAFYNLNGSSKCSESRTLRRIKTITLHRTSVVNPFTIPTQPAPIINFPTANVFKSQIIPNERKLLLGGCLRFFRPILSVDKIRIQLWRDARSCPHVQFILLSNSVINLLHRKYITARIIHSSNATLMVIYILSSLTIKWTCTSRPQALHKNLLVVILFFSFYLCHYY